MTYMREQAARLPRGHDLVKAMPFVSLRRSRDSTLPMPRLILHALQVNMRGGRLPEPEADGRRYLKIPLDALSTESGGICHRA
jgi:hypothetical protein